MRLSLRHQMQERFLGELLMAKFAGEEAFAHHSMRRARLSSSGNSEEIIRIAKPWQATSSRS